MERRKFTREFKLEAVKLVKDHRSRLLQPPLFAAADIVGALHRGVYLRKRSIGLCEGTRGPLASSAHPRSIARI